MPLDLVESRRVKAAIDAGKTIQGTRMETFQPKLMAQALLEAAVVAQLKEEADKGLPGCMPAVVELRMSAADAIQMARYLNGERG